MCDHIESNFQIQNLSNKEINIGLPKNGTTGGLAFANDFLYFLMFLEGSINSSTL